MASTPNRHTNTSTQEEEEEDCMFAMKLASAAVVPMTLKAAIDLDLLEIMARAGPGAHLSTAQIASQLPTHNPDATTMLDRMLRVLASHSILTCSFVTREDGSTERLYGLAPVCKFLTRNGDGVSIAPLVVLIHDKVFMETWYYLKDAVLEGGVPFDKAHGMSVFEYLTTDPRFNNVFNKGMLNPTTIVMKKILETYKGFEGLNEVVDVGGGVGATLHIIISKYPHIKGINYDLPHVIAEAAAFKGVEHVAGNMFVSVPSGEAIFLKWILHDWSDERCLKLLNNCYKALPDSGKVIIVELILPLFPDTSLTAKYIFQHDMLMSAYTHGGNVRTEKQLEELAKGAGFASLNVVRCAYGFSVMECYKKM
ncbi:caffeic acid 3-O-methyltransferase 1 [Cinnamomum micranthum f. kanehirae]|uniref:Caffeic acid 3-O-methyltransferase 1 n=1 Tax=Cinnamomum micranthum f. kanehirae TaxID=337451 RepID=A0A443P6Z5_9MAGN|nr:caffeic acid 3-O-methyltransferase 1 [Cinnamomum micranthum f. kanehirae]